MDNDGKWQWKTFLRYKSCGKFERVVAIIVPFHKLLMYSLLRMRRDLRLWMRKFFHRAFENCESYSQDLQ